MSIDAVALLHVSAAAARKSVPDAEYVTRLGPDACGVSLFQKHAELQISPAQAAIRLHADLGAALALHHDPRGVLLFPDVAEPGPAKYEALVASLEEASFWIDLGLLALSDQKLRVLEAKHERAGGFIERLGGLITRTGEERTGAIVAIDLHNTMPSAEDFRQISQIKTLRVLDLRRVVTLTRSAILELVKLPKLERLVLDELKIGDAELELMAGAQSLSSLSVVKTRIQGAGFAALAGLPALKELFIGFTPLDDAGLRVIAKLPHLEVLKLAPSNVTDAGIKRLARHPRLRVLDASRTRITDAVVPALLEAPALRTLTLRGTAISETGLSRLRARKNLQVSA